MEYPRKDSEGGLLLVVRPKNKKLALKIAKHAQMMQIWPEFDEMNDKCGPYTFQGYLSIKGEIIFDKGNGYVKVGNCKPGDSFISEIKKEKEDENT